MSLKQEAKKEIQRIEKILQTLKLRNRKGKKLLELIKAYFQDSKYFFQKKKYLQAFEAAVICWAYVDAGLHLKVFSVGKEIRKWFTC